MSNSPRKFEPGKIISEALTVLEKLNDFNHDPKYKKNYDIFTSEFMSFQTALRKANASKIFDVTESSSQNLDAEIDDLITDENTSKEFRKLILNNVNTLNSYYNFTQQAAKSVKNIADNDFALFNIKTRQKINATTFFVDQIGPECFKLCSKIIRGVQNLDFESHREDYLKAVLLNLGLEDRNFSNEYNDQLIRDLNYKKYLVIAGVSQILAGFYSENDDHFHQYLEMAKQAINSAEQFQPKINYREPQVRIFSQQRFPTDIDEEEVERMLLDQELGSESNLI
ncbi:MAG: hypothetical protein OHK0017_00880 [Patescibacteria group bacterium]